MCAQRAVIIPEHHIRPGALLSNSSGPGMSKFFLGMCRSPEPLRPNGCLIHMARHKCSPGICQTGTVAHRNGGTPDPARSFWSEQSDMKINERK